MPEKKKVNSALGNRMEMESAAEATGSSNLTKIKLL